MYSLIEDMIFGDINYNLNKRKDYCVEKYEGGHILTVEMPGVTKDHVKLTADENKIDIEFERKDYLKGKFKKSFFVGDRVDFDKIDCKLEHGLLKIDLPLLEKIKPKALHIK